MEQLRRLVQAALGIIFRHPITATSIIPILPDGRIVLVQRQDNGKWGLPGGIVDWGEEISTSVRRELKEETGLELLQVNRLVGVYSSPDRDPRFHSICIVVETAVEGTMQIQDKLEITDVQAFLPSALPIGTLTHDHDQQLRDYLSGQITLA
jgi:ADP-ribose pyrophosphatase YjhB (NUDIX family)